MRKILVALAFLVVSVSTPAFADTIVNEHTIVRDAGYTEVGSGIAYHDGSQWRETNPTIVEDASSWYVSESPMPWSVSKSEKKLIITRGGKSIGIKPAGVYYLNTDTNDWTNVESPTLPSATTTTTTSVTFEDVYTNVDIEIISHDHGPQWNYHIQSKAGYPVTPYPADDTWVVFAHELDITDPPQILENGTTSTTWGGGLIHDITFVGQGVRSSWKISPEEAVSSDTEDNRARIKNALIQKGGTYYYLEGIPYSFFSGKTAPFLLHYTTVGGALSADTTWASGTYYVTSDVTTGVYNLTINAGVVVKFSGSGDGIAVDDAAGHLEIDGTQADPVIFTSCSDSTYGEDMNGVGTCDTTPAAGEWDAIVLNFHSMNAEFFILRYGGSTAGGGIYSAGAPNGTDVGDVYVRGLRVVTSEFATTVGSIVEFSASATSDADLTLIESYFYQDSTTLTGNVVRFANSSRTTGTNVVKNNFWEITDANATSYALNMLALNTTTTEVRNNTFQYDVGGSRGIYINSLQAGGSATATDNYIECNGLTNVVAYHGATINGTWTHENNFSDGCGSNTFATHWVEGASESSSTDCVLKAGDGVHSDNDFVPSWAENFHVASGSNCVDAGSRTASAAGLDEYHIIDDATLDTGTVDVGAHFAPGAAVAAGGSGLFFTVE
jgi:hypothetical protein